ncbi:F0F1 ATP synthase subunit alpha [Candidatus Wolfebacteria bacterium]|nr:F0F1 ATP synthase subunit alpha [Candidatus Wolfebacteria bacterium]
MDTIIKRIQKEIETFTPVKHQEEVGHIRATGDGIVEIEGLSNAMMMEMVLFDKTHDRSLEDALSDDSITYGLILNLEEDVVKAAILGEANSVYEGMLVRRTGRLLSLPVGDELIGRVVNPLAEPVDGKGKTGAKTFVPIEREAYSVIERSPVNTPLHTGIKAVDAMIPLGRGQRELIIGDRFTGKTTIAIDTILNQKNEPKSSRPICIYVAIGQKESKTARIVAELEEKGAMEYTIIVTASAAEPASIQYLAPFAGAAIGEYFMDRGRDALVVYDDLSKQAVAYRQLSLLLRRPPGREAYPGDIFYLHSRLLERAAKLSKEKGGGSLTALPIIETQENDVSAYIPTNVISITDGQIYLEADLFNKGLRPAINVGLSVSRVGSAAQTKAVKSVSGSVRLELAQFRELEAFAQFASDLDKDTKERIDSGRRMTELMNQDKGSPMPFEEIAAILFAAGGDLLTDVDPAKVRSLEADFRSYLAREGAMVLEAIRKEKEISEQSEKKLSELVKKFKKNT